MDTQLRDAERAYSADPTPHNLARLERTRSRTVGDPVAAEIAGLSRVGCLELAAAYYAYPPHRLRWARERARQEWEPLTALGVLRDREGVRRALGLTRMPRGTGAEEQRLAERDATREYEEWEHDQGGEDHLQARMAARRLSRIRALILPLMKECGYRRSKSRWAGGEHTTALSLGAPECYGESHKVWSSNGKWTGNNSRHVVRVPADWERRVYAATGGLQGCLVLDVRDDRVLVVRQSRGFSLRAEWRARKDD